MNLNTPIKEIPRIGHCILGKILEIKNSRTWKKKMILTEAIVEDKTGALKVVWFNQPYLVNVLKAGDRVCLAGKVSLGDKGVFLSNPAYEKIGVFLSNPAYEKIPNLSKEPGSRAIGKFQISNLIHTGRIIPVYPETEGLSSRWFRYILKPLLQRFKNRIPEILPQKIIKKYNLKFISLIQ